MVEIYGKKKGVAVFEVKTEHFAGFKFRLPEGRIRDFGQTQIATFEIALREENSCQVTAGEITIPENAIFIFPFCKWIKGEIGPGKNFSFNVGVAHFFLADIKCICVLANIVSNRIDGYT